LVLLVSWDFLFWSGRFPPNFYIENIDVSGLSKYEALARLKLFDVDEASTSPFILIIDGSQIKFKPSKLGLYIAPRKSLLNASKASYKPNYIFDLVRRATNTYEKRVVPLSLDLDRNEFAAVLKGFAAEIDEPSAEATFSLSDSGKSRITKEKIGKMVDLKGTIDRIEEAINENDRIATVEIKTLYPRVYAGPLVKYPPKTLLAEYTTYFGSHDSPNRVHNIKLAASRTNNYIINSGEAFSLLAELGDFTDDSGYKEAFVIINGELEPQYGGGSCQIASTLYNAALLAGLDIIERYNHGIYFTIYPLGRDASIYSGSRDLKIKNNTNHPIYIKTFATDRKLSYRIYGMPTARKISFSRPMIFFEGEKFIPYDIMGEAGLKKINDALTSGKGFYTYIKVTQELAGLTTTKTIVSHYKLTGDRENVKVVRPEPH
jgi:vancomycin resistance protein YoaR